ncbi:MAG: asparagine synthase (glutamine-hydrolyzing) [Flavobacteriales bacterium]
MCGIAGIIHFNQTPVQFLELKQMTDVLVHRGPDGEGHWINATKNVGLGHRRLSIIDLSDAGKQPMFYAENRYTITYNGEIYNYLEIRKELQGKGYTFKSNTDTEVILAAYDYWGKDCLHQFEGMFAFALWDEKEQELFCARDRFGEKPFYYYRDNEKFVFASEMKALFSLKIKKEINRKKTYEYLLFLTVENPYSHEETFFNNILQLAPSSSMVLNKKGEIKTQKYWDLSTTTTFTGSEEQAVETFKNLFRESVQTRLRSDVSVGSSLSGGLDSSSIVCVMNELIDKNNEQHIFSARFPGFKKDEGKHIAEVVNFCNHARIIQHEVFPTEDSMLKNLRKIMYHQGQPFVSASIAAQFEVMKLASDSNVKVLLDGQGADELLAGYSSSFDSYLRQLYKSNPIKYFSEKKQINQITQNHFSVKGVEGLLLTFFYTQYKKFGNKRRQKINSSDEFFLGMNTELVEEYRSSPNPVYAPPDLKSHLKFMLVDRGLNELLRYADRNSMAHSVEVRLPFLNHKLVEFVFSLPEHYFIRNGWTKYLLRIGMEGVLPTSIQWRKDKIGYEPPQAKWMKNKQLVEMSRNAQQQLINDKILSNKKNIDVTWQHLMLGMLYE